MIKLSALDNQMFIFILEEGNIERLKKGQPIKINLSELGGPSLNIMIHYTDDAEATMRFIKREYNIGQLDGSRKEG